MKLDLFNYTSNTCFERIKRAIKMTDRISGNKESPLRNVYTGSMEIIME